MEGAQHPGHVPQWRRHREALRPATSGLPLEVEDDPSGVGLEHLRQVQVTQTNVTGYSELLVAGGVR